MSYTKRALEEIQSRGWPVDNEHLAKYAKEQANNPISDEDVRSVANDLTIGITDAQIKTVRSLYMEETENRPDDNWRVIVEDLIYSLKS